MRTLSIMIAVGIALMPHAAGRRRCGLRAPDHERKPSRHPKSLAEVLRRDWPRLEATRAQRI